MPSVTTLTPQTSAGPQVTAQFAVLTPPSGHKAAPTIPALGRFAQDVHASMAV